MYIHVHVTQLHSSAVTGRSGVRSIASCCFFFTPHVHTLSIVRGLRYSYKMYILIGNLQHKQTGIHCIHVYYTCRYQEYSNRYSPCTCYVYTLYVTYSYTCLILPSWAPLNFDVRIWWTGLTMYNIIHLIGKSHDNIAQITEALVYTLCLFQSVSSTGSTAQTLRSCQINQV